MLTIEKYFKMSIGFCWSNGNSLTFKSLADSKLFIFKAYKAFVKNLATGIPGRVLIIGETLGETASAYGGLW